MSIPKFAETYNLVAFLKKPTESEGFEQIIDFLNASYVKYALMVNPTVYTLCIEQFWATAKVRNVNEEAQIQVLVDKKKAIITEASIRRDLRFEDEGGVDFLSNEVIFKQLTLIGYEKLSQKLTFYKAFFSSQWKFLIHTILQCLGAKTTAWNEFSSIIAFGRMNEEYMFGVNDLDSDEVVVDVSASKKVEQSVKVLERRLVLLIQLLLLDELTLAQTLIEIKAAKPKVITTVATAVTAGGTRPREKGIVMQEPSEIPSPKLIISSQKSSQDKVKGNGKMIELENPLKRKDQIMIDEEVARNLEAQMQAELEEEERLARQEEEETNIALIES
nr:hypothetical protein [Tanacetum cinerariifolium]